jgi:hypothetical protein
MPDRPEGGVIEINIVSVSVWLNLVEANCGHSATLRVMVEKMLHPRKTLVRGAFFLSFTSSTFLAGEPRLDSEKK